MEIYIIRQPINKVKKFGEVFSVNEQELKWIYEQNEDGTITITGIDFTEFSESTEGIGWYYVAINLAIETLVIPSQIEGKTVVGIDWKDSIVPGLESYQKYGYGVIVEGIEKVIFADTIKKIEHTGIHISFPDVEKIHLPNNLEILGDRVFMISILKAGEMTNKLFQIDIPQNVSKIDGLAFKNRDNLTINFPNGKNGALEIPENNWGASKITISGVEYTN